MSDRDHRPPPGRSLSARLLLLTVAFLLLGEVLIFVPSIARFRQVYLQERIAAAHLATIALDERGDPPSMALADALLSHAGVLSITVIRVRPVLMLGLLPPVDKTVDLAGQGWLELIVEAFETLLNGGQRVIRVVSPSPMEYGTTIDITLTESVLHMEMLDYGKRIILLSLALSAIVGLFLFVSLRSLIVRPLMRITRKVSYFRHHPEDERLDAITFDRSDEIGIVEREFDGMARDLRQALDQKRRLAALGEAVGKLHHDLRNILATALLVSDRLEHSADPAVRAVTPRLVQTLERAIRLCQNTLDYARSRPPRPNRQKVDLRELIDDVLADLPARGPAIALTNDISREVTLTADPDQLHRLFLNLTTNAVEAMPEGGAVTFASRLEGGYCRVTIADTGPGLPEPVRTRLFEPFAASTSAGGAGLGLAISREIARAHGGELEIEKSDASGTIFLLRLPAAAEWAAA